MGSSRWLAVMNSWEDGFVIYVVTGDSPEIGDTSELDHRTLPQRPQADDCATI
jgi:hypothetical protein